MKDKNQICNDIIALIRESYEGMEYIGTKPDMYTLIGIIKEYANPTEDNEEYELLGYSEVMGSFNRLVDSIKH